MKEMWIMMVVFSRITNKEKKILLPCIIEPQFTGRECVNENSEKKNSRMTKKPTFKYIFTTLHI